MTTISTACLIVGTALGIAYLCVGMLVSKRYEPLIANLDDAEHFFKAVYPVGFFALDKANFAHKGSLAQKRLQQCSVIHGELYAEYYLRLNYAQKVSTMLFVLPLGFLLYPLVQSPASFLLGALAVVCAYWNYDMKITDEMEKRADEVARDLPNILSKLTLLVNAGMVLREAWERVSLTGETTLYREMRNAVVEMQNGMPESQAILNFGSRCMNSEVKKFSSTLVQNVSKGNRELTEYLAKQSSIGWEEKKQYARQKGEATSSRLTLPVAGMMIGIMIMIIVPMLGNMSSF